jgi:hypothetical protein
LGGVPGSASWNNSPLGALAGETVSSIPSMRPSAHGHLLSSTMAWPVGPISLKLS